MIYDGNREQRRAIREKYIATQNFNVLMTTFEFAMRDKSVLRTVPWEYIIIDEAHRLKNPKCKLAMELATYPTRSRRVALTGTPLQNELHELWSLLNFLHPTIFNSCENFEKWCVNHKQHTRATSHAHCSGCWLTVGTVSLKYVCALLC